MNASWSLTEITVRLIGKYPFNLGSFTLFPLAGIEKEFCLGGSSGGVAFTSDQTIDVSPWYLVAGVGGDVKITPRIYARAELTAAYNLTSEFAPSFYSAQSAIYQSSTGWEIELAAGIGFLL
jgi:hypothetical protein